MNRRDAVLAAAALGGAPLRVAAAAPKLFRIGVLSLDLPPEMVPLGLVMSVHGYEENRNVVFETRFANGRRPFSASVL